MEIRPAQRVTEIQEYYFSRKLKEVARLNAEGKDIVSLAIGSPDMPPSPQVIEKLCEVAHDPSAHGYQPTVGIPELRKAMAHFYRKWYGVELDWATEIQPLIGSKEGIGLRRPGAHGPEPREADVDQLSQYAHRWQRPRGDL